MALTVPAHILFLLGWFHSEHAVLCRGQSTFLAYLNSCGLYFTLRLIPPCLPGLLFLETSQESSLNHNFFSLHVRKTSIMWITPKPADSRRSNQCMLDHGYRDLEYVDTSMWYNASRKINSPGYASWEGVLRILLSNKKFIFLHYLVSLLSLSYLGYCWFLECLQVNFLIISSKCFQSIMLDAHDTCQSLFLFPFSPSLCLLITFSLGMKNLKYKYRVKWYINNKK